MDECDVAGTTCLIYVHHIGVLVDKLHVHVHYIIVYIIIINLNSTS